MKTVTFSVDHVVIEVMDLPEIEHTVDAGEFGDVEVTIDLEKYASEIAECAVLFDVELTAEEVVKTFKNENELDSMFSELVRQCGLPEVERRLEGVKA